MVSNVIGNNDGELVVVKMDSYEDKVKFISDLRDNLQKFNLQSANEYKVSFTAYSISFSNSSNSDSYRMCNYTINFSDKVLIRNKMIVLTDCSSLLSHKVLITKN